MDGARVFEVQHLFQKDRCMELRSDFVGDNGKVFAISYDGYLHCS